MIPAQGSLNPTQSSLNPSTQRPNSYFYGNSEEIINGYFTTPSPDFSGPEPEQVPEPNPAPGIQIIPEPTFSLSTVTQALNPTQIPQIPSQGPTVTISFSTSNPSSPTLQSSFPTLQPFTPTHIPVHQSHEPTRIPSLLSTTSTQLPSSRPTELPSSRPSQLPSSRPTQLPSSRPTRLQSSRPTKLQDINLPPGPRVKKNSHISTTLTPHLSHSSIFQQFGDLVSVNISTYGEPKIKPKDENDNYYDDGYDVDDDDDDDDDARDDKKSSPTKYSISRDFNIDPIDKFKLVEDRIDVSEEKETYTVDSGSVRIKNWENPNPILNPMLGILSTPSPKSVFESTPVPNMIKSTPFPNMIKSIPVPNMIKSTPSFNPILISTTQGFSPTYPTTAATALYRTEPPTTDLPTTIMTTTNAPTTTATTLKTTSKRGIMSIRDAIYAKKRRPTKLALIKSTSESSIKDEEMTISEVTKLTSEPVVSSWSPLQRGSTTTTKPDRSPTKPAWLR